MKAKKKKLTQLQKDWQKVGNMVLAKREYPFKTKCKNCGHENGMATGDKNLSHLECSKCKKVGTTFYSERTKIMAKVRTKRAKARRVKKAKAKRKTPKKVIKRVKGKNGLGVIATWIKLFKDNPREKLTDEQISKAIKKNFPGRDSAIFDHVQSVRNRYNKGALTRGKTPAVESKRYAADGSVCTARGSTVKKAKKTKKKAKKAKKAKRN